MTTFVSASVRDNAPDSTDVIVLPQSGLLAAQALIAPSHVCTMTNKEMVILITDVLKGSALLPTGSFIAACDFHNALHLIIVLNSTDDPSTPSTPSARPLQ